PAARPLILLVDIDRRAGRSLAKMLSTDGFDVELTVNGASAIARLAQGPVPDAVVTDLFMPYADGLAIARFARSMKPSIAAILVTGHAELVDNTAESIQPAPTVLAKPVDYDVLTRTLRGLLAVA